MGWSCVSVSGLGRTERLDLSGTGGYIRACFSKQLFGLFRQVVASGCFSVLTTRDTGTARLTLDRKHICLGIGHSYQTMRYAHLLPLVAATSCVSASPRRLAGRDDVKMSPASREAVSPGHVGELMVKYKPLLDVRDGCNPAVAFDDQGNSKYDLFAAFPSSPQSPLTQHPSPGLTPNSDNQKLCMDRAQPTGQLYARGQFANGQTIIMYSYYFPLIYSGAHDGASSPSSTTDHTHDFQTIIVTIDNNKLLTVAWTYGPAGYKKTQTPPCDPKNNARLLFTYRRNADGSHGLAPTLSHGLDLPVLAWDRLTRPAQDATRDKNRWLVAKGDKKGLYPPFADDVFQSHLDAAQKADFYYSA